MRSIAIKLAVIVFATGVSASPALGEETTSQAATELATYAYGCLQLQDAGCLEEAISDSIRFSGNRPLSCGLGDDHGGSRPALFAQCVFSHDMSDASGSHRPSRLSLYEILLQCFAPENEYLESYGHFLTESGWMCSIRNERGRPVLWSVVLGC
jgi:hypothetical protein